MTNQERQLQESIWSEVYHATIRGSKWLSPELPFPPVKGAIGYPMQYVRDAGALCFANIYSGEKDVTIIVPERLRFLRLM